MKTFRTLFILVLSLATLSLVAQNEIKGKWQLGVQYGQGMSDWSSDFPLIAYQDYYGAGITLNRALFSYFSLSSGVNLNFARTDQKALWRYCPTGGPENLYYGDRGVQLEIPLLIRFKSNQKRRFGFHIDAGLSLFWMRGKAVPMFRNERDEKKPYGHLFTGLQFLGGLNYRFSPSVELFVSGRCGRDFGEYPDLVTAGLQASVMYRLPKKD